MLPGLLLWPLPAVMTTHLLAASDQEAAAHVWGLWAAWQERAPLVIDTDLISFPDGTSIVLIDPLNILLFNLGHALSGPALGYNLVLYIGMVIMGLGGWLLARRAGGDGIVGVIAGQACPSFIASPATGMTEELGVGLTAVFLAALLRFVDGGQARVGAAAAALLALCWYAGPYNGLWAAMLGGAVGLAALRDRPRLLRATAVGVAGMLLTLPMVHAILLRRHQNLPGTARPGALPDPGVPIQGGFRGGLPFGGDLLDPLLPVQLTGGEAAISHTAYLGLITLILAGVGLWRWRAGWRWMLGGLVFMVLSLGPYLYLGGAMLRYGDQPLLAPAGLLLLALSGLGQVTRWNRTAAVAHLLLVPLIARIAPGRWAARLLIAAALLVDALVFAPLAWPLHAQRAPTAAAYAQLTHPGAILEMPLVSTTQPPPDMWRDGNALRQTLHHRSIGGGLMQTPNADFARKAHSRVQALMRGAPLTAVFREKMLDAGFSYLAIYPRLKRMDRGLEMRLGTCFGAPLWKGELMWLYDLRGGAGGGCFLTAPPVEVPE